MFYLHKINIRHETVNLYFVFGVNQFQRSSASSFAAAFVYWYYVSSFRRCWNTVLNEACSPNTEYWGRQFIFALIDEDNKTSFDPAVKLELSSFMASIMSASLNSISFMCGRGSVLQSLKTSMLGKLNNSYVRVCVDFVIIVTKNKLSYKTPIVLFAYFCFSEFWMTGRSVHFGSLLFFLNVTKQKK